jgi:hypothetical protein
VSRTVKQRDDFMPFAPSVLAEEAARWFDNKGDANFMQFAFRATDEARRRVPNVVHADGTSRIQTVTKENSPLLRTVLDHFNRLTGIPILLNTSMNRSGEPIAETPEDALHVLDATGLDAILFDDDVIVARPTLNLAATLQSMSREVIDVEQPQALVRFERGESAANMARTVSAVFPYADIEVRTRFGLLPEYLEWLRVGRKSTTVRYRPGALDLPSAWVLPLETHSAAGVPSRDETHSVRIVSVTLKYFRDLSDEDAANDGFTSLADLKQALSHLYGTELIPNTAPVSVYRIVLHGDA